MTLYDPSVMGCRVKWRNDLSQLMDEEFATEQEAEEFAAQLQEKANALTARDRAQDAAQQEKLAEYQPPAAAAVERMITRLRERWPAAFSHPPQPLMIDVSRHIAAALYPKDWALWGYGLFSFTRYGRALRAAMHQWTRSPQYLSGCSVGAARVDLSGNVVS